MQSLKWLDPLLSFINKKHKISFNTQSNNLHEALGPISWLEGTWRSVKGVMDHPKIKVPFLFDEIISFTSMGHQPLYYYTSVATNPQDKNALLHLEVGHLIINECKAVGLLAVHRFGCTTIEQGLLKNDTVLEMSSCEIGSSKFIKKPLYGTYRIYSLNRHGQLTYKLALASYPGKLVDHIWCTYEKQDNCT
ncbi:uncharacterized protein LOC130448802 [Diorhabda sublineata]|uniref:uncharacterized protein LOC130448802 n=1 Tax=Diorhabda sublineata TaxID=1163346 RepID=UPI0024E14BB6|nr:uncharacterized protein LOC130448802 [Diorhabda sublineata]